MSKSANLKTKPIDLIIQGMKLEAIEDKVSEVYAIGDCVNPRTVMNAI